MRIDGALGYEPLSVRGKSQSPAERSSKAGSSGSSSASKGKKLSRDEAVYLSKALSVKEVNADAVEEAKRLLALHQLDSPEAIERAAMTLLEGI